MVFKETSQYKNIWICYQALKSSTWKTENSWRWKNAKNPLLADPILFKLLLFSKQTRDLLALYPSVPLTEAQV